MCQRDSQGPQSAGVRVAGGPGHLVQEWPCSAGCGLGVPVPRALLQRSKQHISRAVLTPVFVFRHLGKFLFLLCLDTVTINRMQN